MEKMIEAKVFKSGNSQAIRIPKEFRVDSDIVIIEKEDDKLIITPIKKNPREGWEEKFSKSQELLIDDALDIQEWQDL
ncbi:antitoxin [Nitrosophilus kaiyonis]|uniref:antitoxin n=1 Tax=Nitrosophilus kaiyonis TaxID=2930200 RepID=UPI002491C6F0|nr:AbrB/MazE/SpoVT family DNA-binding domain-containing protein [Nitrosophilus kaiyonis]